MKVNSWEEYLDCHTLWEIWCGIAIAILGLGVSIGLPLWLLYKLFFVWLP